MEKLIQQQKEFIGEFTRKKPTDNPIENMALIKSQMSVLVRDKDKSFSDSLQYRQAERLYKSITSEIEFLTKAREGLVQKKITVQGKNGAYQKTVWVRSGEKKLSQKKLNAIKESIKEQFKNLVKFNDKESLEQFDDEVAELKESEAYKQAPKEYKETIDSKIDSARDFFDKTLRESKLEGVEIRRLANYFREDLSNNWEDIAKHGAGGGFPGITYTKDNLAHLQGTQRSSFRGILREGLEQGMFGDENNPQFSLFGNKFDEDQTEQVLEYINTGNAPEDSQAIDYIVWYAVEQIADQMYNRD